MPEQDVEAIHRVYERTWRDLVRLAVLLVDDLGTAEDVVQDVFAALQASRLRRGTPDNIEAYLRTAVVNRSRSELRKRRIRRTFADRLSGSESGVADAGNEAIHDVDLVGRAISRLSRRQREVIVLRYWNSLSVHQTAEILGISEGTVKATANQAIRKLRATIGEDDA